MDNQIRNNLLNTRRQSIRTVVNCARKISKIWGRKPSELFHTDLSGFQLWIDGNTKNANDLMAKELPVAKCIEASTQYGLMRNNNETIRLIEFACELERHHFKVTEVEKLLEKTR